MKLRQIGILILSVLMLQSAQASDRDQDLHWFKYVLQFSQMSQKDLRQYLNPLVGETQFRLDKDHAPWAGNYFPMQDGGIANRWRSKEYPKQVLDRNSINEMTPNVLNHSKKTL